ncbi:MAG: AAA family ATPase [Planctomycetota bacterium]|nr:MAG: AAA family ATPase [Planctomycetota bacterium]
MPPEDESIRALREALAVSPDNVPLRAHLAESLAARGWHDEAEKEFRTALQADGQNASLLLGLAKLYWRQGKDSQALVIVEDLAKKRDVAAGVLVLYARLLLRGGDVRGAVAQYKLALEHDPDSADDELGRQLGVGPEDDTSEVVEGRVRTGGEGWDAPLEMEIERPPITFADVGGMDAVKEEIGIKILMPLEHPELYAAYGKSTGGGILMYGPPGCGKTYIARATAGEIGAGFIAVGINEVLNMWMGQSERNLHELFEQARHNAPCVLFFDEADALGGRRTDMHSGSGRQMINQFLAEMDGVNSSNEGVLILAATNAPWHVDPAFRRPGRFDRVLLVPPPDKEARAAILRIHLQGKPQEMIDVPRIAQKTEGFSGADLKAVIDQAIEHKLREAVKLGRPHPLTTKDLLAAAKGMKPSTREWFSSARNYALYSNQGGIYDDVLKYLKM